MKLINYWSLTTLLFSCLLLFDFPYFSWKFSWFTSLYCFKGKMWELQVSVTLRKTNFLFWTVFFFKLAERIVPENPQYVDIVLGDDIRNSLNKNWKKMETEEMAPSVKTILVKMYKDLYFILQKQSKNPSMAHMHLHLHHWSRDKSISETYW